ncbi:BLUF domain-containing protein [Planktotalea sp.]|uniref:BLUF domain-containing protein n=1 Tax=Planktotalea sp. TaxID=2029877 RepID=UPI003F6A75F6
MDINFVLYRSKAKRHLRGRVVSEIVRVSLLNNQRNGLTGFLHTDKDHFLQYLEGPKEPLMRRLSIIQQDERHNTFNILADGTLDERLFPHWDMGQIELLQTQFNLSSIDMGWMRPGQDVDPLPLLTAFAAHALEGEKVTITAVT